MVNYSVTEWVSTVGPLRTVSTLIEQKLETIDNSKTIRLIQVIPIGSDNAQGIIVYDT